MIAQRKSPRLAAGAPGCPLFYFAGDPYFLKVSAHAAASFGVAGLLVGYNQTQIAFFESETFPNLGFTLFILVLSGLIVTGRLYLKAHTLTEVLTGMALGFFGIYCCVKFGIYI